MTSCGAHLFEPQSVIGLTFISVLAFLQMEKAYSEVSSLECYAWVVKNVLQGIGIAFGNGIIVKKVVFLNCCLLVLCVLVSGVIS